MLYQGITLPSEKPVEYVGVYVLKWGHLDEPTMGFIPIYPETIVKFAELCRRYPEEPAMTLLEMALGEG